MLALKFVLHGALGGGGPRSLRSDNLGKTLGAGAAAAAGRGARCGAGAVGAATAGGAPIPR